jgi:hypothetical protein
MRVSPRTAAIIGICVQFAALIRCLAEFFRLKHSLGAAFTLAGVEPFILGALVASVFTLAAVVAYFAEKFRLSTVIATVNVAVLLVLRFLLL